MICNRLPEGWTNPFQCCVHENVGVGTKLNRRLYHVAEGVKLFGVTTMLGDDEPPAWAWATWTAQEAERLFVLHEKGQMDKKFEAVWNGEAIEWASSDVHPSERLRADYLKGEGARRSQAARDRGHVVEKLLKAWQELGMVRKQDLQHWLEDVLTQYREDLMPWQCRFDEAYPFAASLQSWLETNEVEVLQTDVFVLNPDMGYATVVDAWVKMGKNIYSVNLKTASSATRKHAEQVAAEFMATHFLPHGTQEAIPFDDLRREMIPAIILCTEKSTRLRKLDDVDTWWKSFQFARERFLLSLNAVPFDTVKE